MTNTEENNENNIFLSQDSLSDDDDYYDFEKVVKKRRHIKDMLIRPVSSQCLADIFGIDDEKVRRILKDVQPDETYRREKRYYIRNVAKYLTKPDDSHLVEFFKNLRPNDLPPDLNFNFWRAQNEKAKLLYTSGQLFRKEKVLDLYSSMISDVSNSLELLNESIKNKIQINTNNVNTDDIIKDIDSVFEATKEGLYNNFKGYVDKSKTTNYRISEEGDEGNEDYIIE